MWQIAFHMFFARAVRFWFWLVMAWVSATSEQPIPRTSCGRPISLAATLKRIYGAWEHELGLPAEKLAKCTAMASLTLIKQQPCFLRPKHDMNATVQRHRVDATSHDETCSMGHT